MPDHARGERDQHGAQGDQHGRKHQKQGGQQRQHRAPKARHPGPNFGHQFPSHPLKGHQSPNGKGDLRQVVLGQPHLQQGWQIQPHQGLASLAFIRFFRGRLVFFGKHAPQSLGFLPFQCVNPQFRAAGSCRVHTQSADPEQALNQVLFKVNRLNALQRDVHSLPHEDALLDQEFATLNVEGEPPKMKHGAKDREHCARREGPKEVFGVLFLLDVRRDQQRARPLAKSTVLANPQGRAAPPRVGVLVPQMDGWHHPWLASSSILRMFRAVDMLNPGISRLAPEAPAV